MNTYDKNGAWLVTTLTKQERERQDEAPVVHFVASERYEPVGD